MLKAIAYGLAFNAVMFGAALAALFLSGGRGVVVGGVVGFGLGSAVGSFLNLFVYRVRAGIPVNGRPSHCPKCGVPIKDRHNVPVFGWLWLRGRCAACGDPISWHYLAVEFACGCAGAAAVVLVVRLVG